MQALVAELQAQLRTAQHDNARLRHQLEQALRRLYGRTAERLEDVPGQGALGLGDPPVAAADGGADEPPDAPDEPTTSTGDAGGQRRRRRHRAA